RRPIAARSPAMAPAAWRSRPARRPTRPTRRAASPRRGSRSAQRRLDLDAALQGARHRRLLGDLGAARALLYVKALEAEVAVDMRRLPFPAVRQAHMNTGKWPFLALAVHAERDRRAGAQARQQQSERRGAGVAAARAGRLVGGQRVVAGMDLDRIRRGGGIQLDDGPGDDAAR